MRLSEDTCSILQMSLNYLIILSLIILSSQKSSESLLNSWIETKYSFQMTIKKLSNSMNFKSYKTKFQVKFPAFHLQTI